MIHASDIAESVVAPTLFRPEFSHSLDPKRTFGTDYREKDVELIGKFGA